jgi:hypothetical protein
MKRGQIPASPALVEILAETGELDAILSGRGLTFTPAPAAPPAEPPTTF